MKIPSLLALTGLVLSAVTRLAAQTPSLESAPPVIVSTVPVAGVTDADPGLTELRVTFSKPMKLDSWSWSMWGQENYPETTGKPRYLSDGRTCVLPVKLQPGKFYAIWLNSDKFKNFMDARQTPAVPYLFTFTTRAAENTAVLPPKQVVAEAVDTISQCTESDPRVATALGRLRSLPAAQVVAALTPYLASDKDVVRRSAIFVVWKGELTDLTPVVAPLTNLLSHSEDLTRGMAALAVGQNRIAAGFEPLVAMTSKDPSGYARRCAAYALGLLGDKRAVTVLEAALKDSESLVRKNAEAALEMLKKDQTSKTSPSRNAESSPAALANDALLNDNQRAVLAWTDRQFGSYFDRRTFDGWSEPERANLEKRTLDALKGPRNEEYYQAINTLAALKSSNGLPALREIAFERVDGNNRNRWMCVRALGLMGDKAAVPDLIHLVYHGNANTHWWAQITLVRLTGKNFGGDWSAWGKWWNESGGQPPYKSEIIRWWNGQAEPDKLAASLEEADRKFLNDIKTPSGADNARGAPSPSGDEYVQQQLKLAETGDYWGKMNLWMAFAKGGHGVSKNPAEADKWLAELVKGAYLAKFEPVKGFNPRTPSEMLGQFSQHSQLRSGPHSLGGASFFRTTRQNDILIGSFLTELPDEFKKAVEENPNLKLISIEKLTPEMFLKHEASKQESL